MDYDFMNLDAEVFIQVFTTSNIKYIQQLKLERHILAENNKCKYYAFKICEIYFRNNMQMDWKAKQEVMNAREALEIYEEWQKRKTLNSQKTENYQIEGTLNNQQNIIMMQIKVKEWE